MPKGTPPDAEGRRQLKAIAAVVGESMDALNWTTGRLADATGYTPSFIMALRKGHGWTFPSKVALRYVFDVMGVDVSDPAVAEAISYGSDRHVCSKAVKAAMSRHYDRQAGYRTDPEPVASATLPPSTLPARQRALDEIMAQLAALDHVGWDDVIEWLEKYAHDLHEEQRGRIMRAVWA